MSELVTQESGSVLDIGKSKYTAKDLTTLASSGVYLPRIQLYQSGSNAVKERKIDMAHYGLVTSKEIVDLGEVVDVIPICWRPKAMDISDNDNIITSFDHESAVFADIQERSTIADSSCMCGPEYLVWLGNKEIFATFFLSTGSSKRIAGDLEARLGKPTSLKATYIRKPKFTWHAPVVTACSTPFAFPLQEDVLDQKEIFENPPAPVVKEKVDASGNTARQR